MDVSELQRKAALRIVAPSQNFTYGAEVGHEKTSVIWFDGHKMYAGLERGVRWKLLPAEISGRLQQRAEPSREID